ncbi:MAG: AMP-binding protein [Planctomycetota bacterium]
MSNDLKNQDSIPGSVEDIFCTESSAQNKWQQICQRLEPEDVTPDIYRSLWDRTFQNYDEKLNGPAVMWTGSDDLISRANVFKWSSEKGLSSYAEFHDWSINSRAEFWLEASTRLGIRFETAAVSPLTGTADDPSWFPESRLNIVESCFAADAGDTAIIAQLPGQELRRTSYGELRALVNRVSNSVVEAGFKPGDALAVVLPMTELSVAIYLGIVQAGCAVVSIADSFAPPEISSRLRISDAVAVFTYDVQRRAGKAHPLYQRVAESTAVPVFVIPDSGSVSVPLRDQDKEWSDFLVENDRFQPVVCDAQSTINILFSSGTTGDPKAIPWSHLTPIRCAVDGYCHQDIHTGDVCAWPTNLGWMMGPWLIFASLINKATIALYEDAPVGEAFGRFVENAGVNMLGVVPTLVRAWRKTGCMENCDWSKIHAFSSTGESSQRDDMFYLSSLAGMRPVIEYCGGTEIGGGYVTSVVTLPNAPAAFNTPSVGLDFLLLDADQTPGEEGEVFLLPPSIGLSTRLLNRDHHDTYFADTPELDGYPPLRRHGDHFRKMDGSANGIEGLSFYSAGGRVDDTMNLGGIKVSSAEIERVLNRINGIRETAAIAVAVDGGPDRLEIFAVPDGEFAGPEDTGSDAFVKQMNGLLKAELNPLFRVHQIHFIETMPRTASNKLMRRELRKQLAEDA